MEILSLFAAIVAVVWGVIFALRGSLLVASAIYLAVAATFGYQFFHASFCGVTLSMDRLLLMGLLAGFAIQWKMNRTAPKRWSMAEYALLLFFSILVVNTFAHDWRRSFPDQEPILPHLVEGYFIPLLLYAMARQSTYSPRVLRWLYAVIGVFGVYLACTAICEMLHAWPLVFPRYIADPELGIHFGRARGPFLQSVRLGIYLTAGLAAVWIPLVWQRIGGRVGLLTGLLASGLLIVALGSTLTRSIWMGLLAGIVIIASTTFSKRYRTLTLYSLLVSAALIVPLKDTLLSFQREYGSQETLESTRMRAVFTYVSWLMIQDQPWLGFGFGHFPHEKEAYLNDRKTDLRLGSIRGYVHHNTYLSILVELGIVGFVPFLAVLVCWWMLAWRMWRDRTAPTDFRGHALVCMVVLATHQIQMLFHDVTYTVFENSILFLGAGMLSGMCASRVWTTVRATDRRSYRVAGGLTGIEQFAGSGGR